MEFTQELLNLIDIVAMPPVPELSQITIDFLNSINL